MSNTFTRSDLISLYNIVQNGMIVFPKEIIISTLKEFFSKDSYYHFVADEWGFNKTPDHTDLPIDAGIENNLTSRLFIGESYAFTGIYYPAIIVRHGGSNYVPISFNREKSTVQYKTRTYQDGYGNVKNIKYPANFVFSGAWEGTIIIEVFTRSLRSRDDLTELISILFTDIEFDLLERAGILIKGVNVGSPSEQEDRNDKLFRQTITLNVRSEWRREIPIGDVIEIINFAIEFGRTDASTPIAANLTINTEETLVDILNSVKFEEP